jgi:hypothetical protein
MVSNRARRMWSVFQATVGKHGDNSMGTYNELICEFFLEQMSNYKEKEFKEWIEKHFAKEQ